jgi:L-threonylcarbamoyladenylate synthase
VWSGAGSMADSDVAAAASALGRGELVVLPTDTVYGVAARPDIPGATGRIFDTKRRPRGLTLPLLCAATAQVEDVASMDGRARVLARRFWPGGLTMVLPRTERSRAWDLGEERATVGVRIPAHRIARALLELTGPLAVTSANRSGEPTPDDCDGVRVALGNAVAVYLCEGHTGGVASTVIDLTRPAVRVLRHGAIPATDVMAALA